MKRGDNFKVNISNPAKTITMNISDAFDIEKVNDLLGGMND